MGLVVCVEGFFFFFGVVVCFFPEDDKQLIS